MDRRPEYDKELIGDNLRRRRQARNLSVEQVREYLGLGSTQSIYKWEEGRSFPQADNLFALMEWYGMELKDLLYGQRQFCMPAIGHMPCSGADMGVCGAMAEHMPCGGRGIRFWSPMAEHTPCSRAGAAYMQSCELILEQQCYGEKENMQGIKRWVLYAGKVNGRAA
ncbi:helix-turn-helix transcriptional regulator [Lachnospiraceae bacterium JLR.KK009]